MIVLASLAGASQAVRHTAVWLTSPQPETSRVPGRHWRGQLPPWRSVLVNWIAVGSLSSRLLESGANAATLPLVDAPLLYFAVRLPFYLLAFAILAWGAVGALRSLTRWGRETGRRWRGILGQALVASIVAILLAQIVLHHVRFPSIQTMVVFVARLRDDKRPADFALSADRRQLSMYGRITVASADDFQRLLDDYPQIRVLRISSPGGLVVASFTMADHVKRRGLDTLVQGRCLSACTVVFLAGKQRVATTDARIGFHATDSVRFGYADGALRAYLLGAGLSESFVDRAMNTPNASMWYPALDRLLEERIVTRAVEPDDDD